MKLNIITFSLFGFFLLNSFSSLSQFSGVSINTFVGTGNTTLMNANNDWSHLTSNQSGLFLRKEWNVRDAQRKLFIKTGIMNTTFSGLAPGDSAMVMRGEATVLPIQVGVLKNFGRVGLIASGGTAVLLTDKVKRGDVLVRASDGLRLVMDLGLVFPFSEMFSVTLGYRMDSQLAKSKDMKMHYSGIQFGVNIGLGSKERKAS